MIVDGAKMSLLRLMHLNIQGLAGKVADVDRILESEAVDVCCFSEHWLRRCGLGMVSLSDYYLVSGFCRNQYIRGGVSIFAKNDISVKPVDCKFSVEKTIEVTVCSLTLRDRTVFIISLYRSPGSDIKIFIDKLQDVLHFYYKPHLYYIVCGDMNIELLVDSTFSR